MKICILTPNYYTSPRKFPKRIFAPREFALSLISGLIARGHKVYAGTAPDIHTQAKKISGSESLLFHPLKSDKFTGRKSLSSQEAYLIFSTKRQYYELDLIERTIEMGVKGEFDIIHADYPLVHFFEQFSKVPIVYTYHDRLPQPNTLGYWILTKYKDHKYIGISKSQLNGTPKINCIGVVHHGLDLSSFKFKLKSSGNYLAFVGRLVPNKGAHVACKIAQDLNMKLHLGIDREHRDSKYYTEIIEPYVKKGVVVPTGYLIKDKNEFYQNARVLLFPIQWEEPFGLVMIEAMACGTPVVAFARGSVPEVIADGIAGFIIDPVRTSGKYVIKKTGTEGMKEAVRRISAMSDNEYFAMRQSCRLHVEKYFTKERMAADYEKIYKRVINTGKEKVS